jgi:hypothetical protein
MQLGRLIETMPNLEAEGPIPAATLHWLGRAHALVNEVSVPMDSIKLRMAVDNLRTAARSFAAQEIYAILYRALAAVEIQVPSSLAGSFIPVGSSFDALAAIAKILQVAKRDVFIVDPYMDESALTEFGQAVPEGVPLRLLADEKDHKPLLAAAATKWAAQFAAARPLAVRLAPSRSLHDRAIFIDGTNAWTLTQSLKDFAKRSPAEIVRADDTAGLKIAAYEQIWTGSKPVV